MIWPTFLDSDGHPLPSGAPVPAQADAHFTILDPALRDTVHRGRLRVGVILQLVEGTRPVADCEVTELFIKAG